MAVIAELDHATVSVEPGGRAGLGVRVRNTGTTDDEARIEVAGQAEAWSSVYPPVLSPRPGTESVARVSIRVPRASTAAAGALPLRIVVRSAAGVQTLDAVLDIAAFVDAAAGLEPRTATGRRGAAYELRVHNRGNAPMSATIEDAQPDGALVVRTDSAVRDVPAGGSVVVPVTARSRRPLLAGRERSTSFALTVTPGPRHDVRAHATLVQRPWLSRPALAALVVVVVAVAGLALRTTTFAPTEPSKAAAVKTATPAACPANNHLSAIAAGAGEAKSRRGHGADPVGYSFLFATANGCQPVRWNPCQPVHYVLNAALAPPGGVRDVREAFRRIAAATGMTFVEDGPSTDLGRDHAFYQPGPNGGRWAPLLVYWYHGGVGADGVEHPANGFPFVVDDVITSGQLGLNVDAISNLTTRAPIPDGFGPGVVWGRFMLHELGHVLGLGHVSDTAELMYPDIGEQTLATTAYGVGDSIGLRLIGRQAGCLRTPTPHPVASDRGQAPVSD